MKKIRHQSSLAAATLLAAAGLAHAQLFPPPAATLQAPVQVKPGGTVIEYDYAAPNLSFVWDQGPVIVAPGSSYPSQFVLCLKRINEGACSHATATHNPLASAIPSVLLRAPWTFAPIAYRYTFTPTIPDIKLDEVVAWQVGGCTKSTDSSCAFSAQTWIVISTQDIQAINLSNNVSGPDYIITAQARNRGSRMSREFKAHLEAWDVLYDPVAERCMNNPNDPSVKNETTLYAIDSKGNVTQFAALPRDAAGNYVVSNVVAIYRPNAGYQWHDSTLEHLILPPTAGMANPPRTDLGNFSVSVPQNTRPRAVATKLTVDSGADLIEFNESNNSIAECEPIFH